jgi:hypothetical protein
MATAPPPVAPVNVCDTYCGCPTHITAETHVPCCPIHRIPLVWSETYAHARCPHARWRTLKDRDGAKYVEKACTVWGVGSWQWIHRATFDDSDLPPWNGQSAPDYPPGLFATPALEFAPTEETR